MTRLADRPHNAIKMRSAFVGAVDRNVALKREKAIWSRRDQGVRAIEAIRGKLVDADRHLSTALGLSPELVGGARKEIAAILERNDFPSDDSTFKTLHRAVVGKPSSFRPRHSEVWAIYNYLFGPDSVTSLRVPQWPRAAEQREAAAAVDLAESNLRAARRNIRMTDTILGASQARGWIGPVDRRAGTRGLEGWTITHLTRGDSVKLRVERRRT
jgi:hypothetical protein